LIGLRWLVTAALALLAGVPMTVSGPSTQLRAGQRGPAPSASRIQFADVTAKAGIGFVHASGASP
jgi:hypothetical protein